MAGAESRLAAATIHPSWPGQKRLSATRARDAKVKADFRLLFFALLASFADKIACSSG
jgi:hypothetical protein